MIKNFTLIAMLLVALSSAGQFVPVSYRGAFAPAPTPMWTDGWTEWNPQNKVYPATTVVIDSNTNVGNTTWRPNNVYLLRGPVKVDSLTALTILPGTVIRGDHTVPNSCIIIRRGGKIYAAGTPQEPIVFTSNKAIGERTPGDWGGIIMLGTATVNSVSGFAFIEGLRQTPESQFGGGLTPNDNDNSGILSYVRIEYGGYVFQPNVEINGLTMGGVGRATRIDHVQTSFVNDDAFEWFGGTVNCSHLVAYRCVDDNWDTDFGYNGNVQFCLGVRDPDLFDPTFGMASGGSTSEGFESDNDAGGSNNNPRTAARFSNVTDIGPFRGTAQPPSDLEGFRRAARIRRNSQSSIFNSILMDWRTGLFIDGASSETNALNGVLNFRNNILAGASNNRNIIRSNATPIANWLGLAGIDSVANTSGLLVTPYNYFAPDYRPAPGSLALIGADFTNSAIAPFVKQVNYRGAFAPAPTPMWTNGWVNWDPKNAAYGAPTVILDSNANVTNTTWTPNNIYLIRGPIKIDSLGALTILPGTIVRGDHDVPNSCIIVRRGAKLYAPGTEQQPIIFTSNKPVGERAPGDWGGIIMLGTATVNTTSGFGFIEGLRQTPESQFGGGLTPNDNDNSGILTYARIEFGGYVFQPNVEINGLTMGAVGRNTEIHHVITSFINDDAFEWFGGTVNCSHLVAYRCVDDNWDVDNGFSGTVQFCLGVRDPDLFDPTFGFPSGGSTSEGFESDNDPGGSNNNPRTSPMFLNVTDIGPFRGTANPPADFEGFRRAARIRRNSQTRIHNSIFMDWRTGLFLDGAGSENAALSGAMRFRNNIIAGAATNRNIQRGNATPIANWAGISNIDSVATTAGILINPYQFFTPDYRPAPGSIALSNFDFSEEALPVSFIKFTGEYEKGISFLDWTTGTEQNNKGFEVERSTNGQNFSRIGYVASKAIDGNSNVALQYSFEDTKPVTGINYYRLKQVDKDGKFAFSKIIVLTTSAGSELTFGHLYPNPVTSSVVRMVVLAPKAELVTFRIVDMSGRSVHSRNIQLVEGINNLEWDVRSLTGGAYFIQAPATGQRSQLFVKQK
jgi:hypothetical protein